MTLFIDPAKLKTEDQTALANGDVIHLQDADSNRPAILCVHGEIKQNTRFVLRHGAKGLLLTELRGEQIRIAGAGDLRLRLGAQQDDIPRDLVECVGLIGVDANGAFVVAAKDRNADTTMDSAAIVRLDDWSRTSDKKRVRLCQMWFSEWQLVHVDEWGRETLIFDFPILLP